MKTKISVSLDRESVEILKIISDNTGISKSAIIDKTVKYFIADLGGLVTNRDWTRIIMKYKEW